MSVLPGCQLSVTRKRTDDSCLLQYANKMRLEDCFTDTTIGVGERRIAAHRIVLACYSRYFEKIFQIKAEYNPSPSITDMDEEPVVKLIEFIYTKEIVINNDNIMALFFTAVKLEIDSAIQICLEYFQSAINMENWFFILNEANLHNVDSLKKLAYKFMSDNFDKVSQSYEFFRLSKTNVSSCISNIDSNNRNETFVYEAIINWTKHNEANRKVEFSDLFLQLNLDQLPNDYLFEVVAEENLVKENLDCSRIVMEKLTLLMKENKLNKSESKILSLGGSWTGSKVIEVFSLSNSVPKTYPDLPMKVENHCSLIIDKILYCIGGQCVDDKNITKKVWQMNLKEENLKWKEIAEMNEKKWLMGAAVYNGHIVVVGGNDKTNRFALTEIYTKPLNKWEFISPMNQERDCHSVETCNGWLYVMGGSYDGNILSSVERLPALHGKWESIEPMQTPRKWFAAVCSQGSIFVIGGHNGTQILKSVERFDTDVMRWEYVKDLNIGRDSHSAGVLDDKIYVVGGLDSSRKVVLEIECYDPSRDTWNIVGQTTDKIFNHSLVVI